MKFACCGRRTAAAADDVDDSRPPGFPGRPPPDDVDNSRPPGFPDPQPPSQGDGDLAAAQRRNELMWDLQLEGIRQDMISRQLAQTERAMALRFGPPAHWPVQALPPSQDYWHHRRPPSLPPLDEAAPRPPRAMTHYSSGFCGNPTAVRPPPVYPHVERSPSPLPGDDGDQQQECRSPGVAPRPMLGGDLGGCRSSSKRTLLEGGALVPSAANAGAGATMPAWFAEEVTPGDRRAARGEETKHVVEDGHGAQPFHGSGSQSTEQMKIVESATMKDRTVELVAQPCQYRPASQQNGASDEQKRVAFKELLSKLNLPKGALVPDAANVGAKATMPVSFTEEVTPGHQWAVGGEPEHGVENDDGVQPFHGSRDQSSEQRATLESTVKDRTDELVARPCQHGPSSLEHGASDEQKRVAFREAKQTSLMDGCQSPSKLNLPEGALVPGAANGEPVARPWQYRPTSEENGAWNEWNILAFREPTPQAEWLKRKLITATYSPVIITKKQKKQKPPKWTCDLCRRVISQNNLASHFAGKRHLSKLKKARKRTAKATLGSSTPLRRNGDESVTENCGGDGSAPRPAEDENREPAPTKCSSASGLQGDLDLLRRQRRENTEAVLAMFRSSYDCRKNDRPGKSVYYCKACDVQCTGDTVLASHLVGRKHRLKTLAGHEE